MFPTMVFGQMTYKLPLPIERINKDICPMHHYRAVFDCFPESLDKIMERRTAYAEMIIEIDRQIGRILECLESADIMDNTTIIFSSDHGDLLGDFNLNAKGPFPYHGQLAVPLIMSNHPGIAPWTRSASLVGNIDIPGTVLDIAGADRSIGVSRSLIDQAQKYPEHPREVNFSEHADAIKIVENKKYRFCYYPFLNFSELFDRENDPKEQVNLAGKLEYVTIENEFLRHIIDFAAVCKGIEIPAYDFVPEQQAGVRKKVPDFERDFKVAFPLKELHIKRLKNAGLSTDYNEFCKKK